VRIEDRLAHLGRRRALLRAPALAYGAVTLARNALYDAGLLRARRLPVPVVSVGNLTAGGTGKTPAVAFLARELQRRGRRVGVLSRGYRPRGAGDDARPLNDALPLNDARPLNDEGKVLARLLPGVQQVQGADRARGGAELVRRGVDAIVLDDGFQHRALARDLELVLLDATRPWGLPPELDTGRGKDGSLLPHGLLREHPHALARAHAILITRADQVGGRELEVLRERTQEFAPGVPVLLSRHRAVALRGADGVARAVETLAGREVDLASGLGNPESFARSVRGLGARIASERRFPDHHVFTGADLEGLGRDGRVLVCTAKDAVKLEALGVPFLALEIELELLEGAQILEALLDALLDSAAASTSDSGPASKRPARPARRLG
jgi:tetraacyldisaccharide 4'-kinase